MNSLTPPDRNPATNPQAQLWLAGALALVAASTLTNCAKKEDDPDAPPKSYARPYRDPVEQRVFYQGWRHPGRD